jgi:hypothetical protein
MLSSKFDASNTCELFLTDRNESLVWIKHIYHIEHKYQTKDIIPKNIDIYERRKKL